MDKEIEQASSALKQNIIINDDAIELNKVESYFSDIDRVFSELMLSVDTINKMVGVVRDISAKTDLLALNASIEAARAGQEGRGFAIVAHEVARLAEKSQESIHKVEQASDMLQEKVHLLSERLDDIQKLLTISKPN